MLAGFLHGFAPAFSTARAGVIR